jgi:hypothetical protein
MTVDGSGWFMWLHRTFWGALQPLALQRLSGLRLVQRPGRRAPSRAAQRPGPATRHLARSREPSAAQHTTRHDTRPDCAAPRAHSALDCLGCAPRGPRVRCVPCAGSGGHWRSVSVPPPPHDSHRAPTSALVLPPRVRERRPEVEPDLPCLAYRCGVELTYTYTPLGSGFCTTGMML